MSRYAPTDVLEDTVGDGRTVFVPATNTAVVLNPTAARIWDLARTQLALEEIAAQVAADYGLGLAEVAPHVVTTVESLVQRGLLAHLE